MNTKLLLSWLGLPAGTTWPPDDRALLGLPPGPVDPFLAEKRALELMDRLRPHQLVQPDLVTEGMNRLAQALVTVTTSAVPPAPPPAPASTRKVSRPVAPAPPPTVALPPAPTFEAVDLAPTNSDSPAAVARGPAPTPTTEPEVVEAEVVEAEVVEAEVVEGPQQETGYVVVPEAELPSNLLTDADVPDYVPAPPVGLVVGRGDRRNAYRELATLRRLRRAWRRLRPSVAVPSEQLLGPAEVCGFLEAVLEVREALARPGLEDTDIGTAGATVRTVVRHQYSLAVFRAMVPSQRQALARDWAIGLAAIETRYGAVRGYLLKDAHARRSGRRRTRAIRRRLERNPEWVLAVLTVFGLLLAAARANRGS